MTLDPTTNLRPSTGRSWATVALLISGATATGLLLDQHISLTSQAMVYVLTVVVASYHLRWQQSVGCALGGVAAFNFFFVPPLWNFQVESQENLIALATMLLVGLVISHLAAQLRRKTEAAHTHAHRVSQLQALASQLSLVSTNDDIAALGQEALHTAFAGPCLLVLCQQDGALEVPEAVSTNDADGLHCCMREAAALGPGTGRWPGLDAWFFPLGKKPQVFGAVCIRPALSSDSQGHEHAQALCALLGQALQRNHLNDSMQKAHSEAQRQQLQSTYLAAISHDLRTPLATVVGAASALQTQRDKLSPQEQDRLLASIASEASYLSTVTENTMQLVHLNNTTQTLKRDWESMEEIVGTVLARIRKQDPTRRIQSKVPEGLPLIEADPVLLAQLIGNLLDNALKYSSDTVDLKVQVHDGTLQVSVKDRGTPIPPEQYARIFEPYTRGDQSGQRGAGLGLALCRAIAAAHGGTLTLRKRSGGGNTFTFAMPLNAHQPEGLPT